MRLLTLSGSCVFVAPLAAAQLASGEVFGKNQPIALQLLGSSRSREALEGVAMELEDSLYPLLREVRGTRARQCPGRMMVAERGCWGGREMAADALGQLVPGKRGHHHSTP